MTNIENPQALEGVRVLDISGPAGFYCTKLMADMGADVVRIDPPDAAGDRYPGPFYGGESDRDHSIYRWHYHTNKRRSEEHTPELQSQAKLVCRLLLDKKKR